MQGTVFHVDSGSSSDAWCAMRQSHASSEDLRITKSSADTRSSATFRCGHMRTLGRTLHESSLSSHM
jgi:hypothetical protein